MAIAEACLRIARQELAVAFTARVAASLATVVIT
jgi:hypothetical protein